MPFYYTAHTVEHPTQTCIYLWLITYQFIYNTYFYIKCQFIIYNDDTKHISVDMRIDTTLYICLSIPTCLLLYNSTT
jgi:hypothetical protein